MKKNRLPKRASDYVVILIGVFFAVAYWILDAAVRTLIFDEGAFSTQMFHPPDSSQIPLRSSIAFMFVIMSIYAQLVIHRHKKSEDAARESEEKYRDLFENANDLIQSVNSDGKFGYVNTKWVEVMGYSQEDLGHLHFVDIVRLDQIPYCMELLEKPLNGEVLRNIETVFVTRDGKEILVEGNVGQKIKDGELVVSRGIFRDITERRRVEAERERLNIELSQKNQELEQIIHVASHDLRSPLVNVEGFSKELTHSLQDLAVILQDEEIPSRIREQSVPILEVDIPEALNHIQTSIPKMDSLISGLLRLSRVGRMTFNIERLDMNELLANIRAYFEYRIKEEGVTLEIGDLPPCRGDAAQINQVFSNILDNSLKYLDPNTPGIITVTGRIEQDQAIYCVEDNGIGIPEEYQNKVFEIFHRLDPASSKGEGLGLTIVKRIVLRHNGNIWMESARGAGCKLFVSLPKDQ